MKFIVSSSLLLKELSIANSVISTKTSLPILECFLFNLNNTQLFITATDMDSTVKIACEVTSSDQGDICIPSKILMEYLKNIDHQPLTFDIKEQDIEIVSDKGRYKFKGEKTETFPKEPLNEAKNQIIIPSKDFSKAIEKTIFAVSQDDVRVALTGILLEGLENKLRLVSTDAHRLVYYDLSEISGTLDNIRVILPKKAASVIRTFLAEDTEGETQMSFSTNHFFLKQANIELMSRLVDAKFPDYRTVIPEQTLYTLKLEKEDLFKTVTRLNIFSSKSNSMIVFTLKGNQLNISAQDKDFSREGMEEIQAEYHGEDLQIAFNGRFLSEILRSIHQKEIVFKLSAPQKPALIHPIEEKNVLDEHLVLLMPLII